MATLYRFLIEQKESGGGGRKARDTTISRHTVAKKGKMVSIFGGEKGGVEHNRKMRAINPLINRATGGAWEKGMRVGRAGLGLIQRDSETGKLGMSGTAFAIIVAFFLQLFLKLLGKEQQKAEKQNMQNFKQLENGIGLINGAYDISTNILTGRHTYNQNK